MIDKVKVAEWFNTLHSEIDKIEQCDNSEPVSRESLVVALKAMYSTIDALREYVEAEK